LGAINLQFFKQSDIQSGFALALFGNQAVDIPTASEEDNTPRLNSFKNVLLGESLRGFFTREEVCFLCVLLSFFDVSMSCKFFLVVVEVVVRASVLMKKGLLARISM
jgi:hypothetical protein